MNEKAKMHMNHPSIHSDLRCFVVIRFNRFEPWVGASLHTQESSSSAETTPMTFPDVEAVDSVGINELITSESLVEFVPPHAVWKLETRTGQPLAEYMVAEGYQKVVQDSTTPR